MLKLVVENVNIKWIYFACLISSNEISLAFELVRSCLAFSRYHNFANRTPPSDSWQRGWLCLQFWNSMLEKTTLIGLLIRFVMVSIYNICEIINYENKQPIRTLNIFISIIIIYTFFTQPGPNKEDLPRQKPQETMCTGPPITF